MKKISLTILLFSGIFCNAISQTAKLTAIYDFNNSAIKLNWNMINTNVRTSYLLLRSTDGVTWTEAAKDRMLRNYTEDDIYFFNDRYFSPGKNFYRLKITDGYNNTIALSPIVAVNTRGTTNTPVTYSNTQSQTGKQSITPKINTAPQDNNKWIIYPNPATDLLKLTYKGSGDLKGVVNVQIQDASGKIVIKFRSGSMYKTIQIPISNLQRGAYFIQVTVVNELMMNQKFIKQ
ncbi:MAG: Metalloprotease Fpp2 [Chitinophagaceae bacterium]|nr:Metalloprotease Fpp2 [Chitinophagaceae bacterium]